MAFDLATAKTRLGIDLADTSSDTRINAGLASARAIVESYCDRVFTLGSQTETFLHVHTPFVQVKRYPIVSVDTFVADGYVSAPRYLVDAEKGLLRFDAFFHTRQLTLTYTGGFDVLPDDVELAHWGVFDAIYSELGQQSGESEATMGDISSITVPDVGTVRFTDGQTTAAAANNAWAGIYGIHFALLDPHRRMAC